MAKVQPAADIIWSNGTEHNLASDVEADLVFCGLTLATLVPVALITSLTQRLMMLLDTGGDQITTVSSQIFCTC